MDKIISPDTYIDFKTADDFIGATLRATKPVTVYSSPAMTKEVARINAGDIVGVIYSWVGGKDGKPLFWSIDRSGSFFGFVKHDFDSFDGQKATETSDLYKSEIKKQLDQQINTSSMFDFLDEIPLAMSRICKLAIGLVGVYLVVKMMGFFKK